jgi:drug/metabolite transporter (DMT)-like permease
VHEPSKNIATVLLTILALIAFAANSVICRLALGEATIDPASYTAIRLTSGAITLWLIAGWTRNKSSAEAPGGWTSAAMLFLYAATFSFAYVSLSAATGALILFASVQFTMITAGLYSGERPGLLEWFGLLIAIGGLLYLLSPGITAPSPLGSVLMLIAGVAWGVYSLRGRGAIDPIGATTSNFVRTVPMVVLVVVPWFSTLTLLPEGLLWAVLSGSVSSGLGYVIWYAALRGLTATRAATVQLSVPVIAAAGGILFLSESLSGRLLIASLMILSGIALAIHGHGRPAEAPALSRAK